MKKGIVALMIIACVALGAFNGFLRFSEDKKAPEILFQDNEITFVQGEDYAELLEGVTATDNRDGDVTQSLVVESVYPNDDGNTATIVYVARDKANNIGKSTKIVNYQKDGKVTKTSKEEMETDDLIPTTSPTPVSDDAFDIQHEMKNGLDDGEDTMTDQNLPKEEIEEETLSAESPRIKLVYQELTIDSGTSVNRIAYVESITDDKDDKDSLWQSIQIEGDTLDVNTTGTYKLVYYVIDSDGNKSNEETLTITVQ